MDSRLYELALEPKWRALAAKFLKPNGRGPYSGYKWPLPKGRRPGRWVRAPGNRLVMCQQGIHATFARSRGALKEWSVGWGSYFDLYLIELEGIHAWGQGKILAQRGRLIELVMDATSIGRWWDRGCPPTLEYHLNRAAQRWRRRALARTPRG